MIDILFDMETRDPDDALTLCLLATHARVCLRAVTVNPGSRAQIGIVREILRRLDRSDVPVGARNLDAERDAVSPFHIQWLGPDLRAESDGHAVDVLAAALQAHPHAILVTGAPLHNLRLLLQRYPELTLDRWVAQGGFAGDAVVPPELRLPKFEGRQTCPTFNFNGDPKGALLALASDRIRQRDLVSKNVCHRFLYDASFHERLAAYAGRNAGLAMVYEAMARYLRDEGVGKMLHDPLAACVAIDRDIASFREVEVFRAQGEWGSRLAEGTHTFITIDADAERFFETFAGTR